MATFRIVVVVDPSGARRGAGQVEGQLNRVNNAADRLRQTIGRALAFGGVAVAVRQLVGLADAFTNVQNRLRIVTNGTAELALVTEELFQVANRTRASFQSTAELYARVGLAARDLGVSQEELINFTESVNQALILSGASAQEASAGLIQLSQGLASGALRGDELRSVLEQLPVVADVIAQELGVTRGELRELGSQGRITADILLRAFRSAREELAEKFAQTIPTISQSFQVLRNRLIELVGAFDTNVGASGVLSRTILFLAENIDTVARAIGALAIVLGVEFALRAVGAAVAGLGQLGLAIALNPIGAIAIALTAAIAALIAFGDQLQLTAGSSATVFDFLTAGFNRLSEVAQVALNFVLGLFGDFQAELDGFDFLQFVRSAARAADALVAVFQGAVLAILNELTNLAARVDAVFTGIANAIPGVELQRVVGQTGLDAGEAFALGVRRSIENTGFNIRGIVEQFAQEAEEIGRERRAREAASRAALEAARSGLGDAPPGVAPVTADSQLFADIIRNLEDERRLIGLSNREREIQQELLRIEGKLKRELLPTEQARIEGLLRENQALAEQQAVLQSIRGPAEDIQERQRVLNELLEQGAITAQEFAQEMRILNTDLTALDNTIQGGILNGFARIAEGANQLGQDVSNFITGAFDRAADAIVNFARTGQLNIRAFFGDLFAQLARLALNQTFSFLAQGIFGGGGGGGLLGSLFGGLPGFASGGSFDVGPRTSVATIPGQDNRVVAFRARDGERVNVSRPGEGGGSGGRTTVNNNTINYNITTPDADSFRRSQDQVLARTNATLQRNQARDR